ncbi:hypothetical protein [Phyllobacterium sp. K27]
MAQGLQVWDASGKLVFDTNDRAGRILFRRAASSVLTGSAIFPPGTKPWVVAVRWLNGAPYHYMGISGIPDMTVATSGQTVSWSIVADGYQYEMIVGCF